MTKLIKIVLLGWCFCLWLTVSLSPVRAVGEDEPFPYDIVSQTPLNTVDTNIAQVIKQDALQPGTNQSIMSRIASFFRVSGTAYNPDNAGSPAIEYVKRIVNLLLGLVSLIALVLIIFAFYLIFFGKEDEAIKKAKKILTGVAIALAIMWLSWFIVSFFFNVFTTVT